MEERKTVSEHGLQPRAPIALILCCALVTWLWSWAAFGREASHSAHYELVLLGGVVALTFISLWWLLSGLTRVLVVVDPLERISACFGAALVFLVFLPEYIIGHQVPAARTYVLLSLAGILFVSFVFILIIRRPSHGQRAGIRRGRIPAALLVIAIAYFFICNYLAIRKFYDFGYVGQDLAYFSQCFYTTIHGHFFYGNLLQDLLYSKPVFSDFAGHNSLIMTVFLPFYYLHPSPVTLLILRNAFMVLCSWPIYLISRRKYSPGVATALCAAFLVLPTIFYQNVFDFYPLSTVAFFLLWTFYFFEEMRFRPFLAFLLLTLAVREDLVFAAFGFGLLALWWRYPRKWILTPLLVSTGWAFFSFKILIPHFLGKATYMESVCFTHLGGTPREIVANVLRHPVQTLFIRNNLIYLKQLLSPLAGLFALGSAVAFLALPYLGINLLAGGGPCITTVPFAQYSVIPVVFLFLGFVVALRKQSSLICGKRFEESDIQLCLVLFVLALSLGCSAFLTGRTEFAEFSNRVWQSEARRVALSIPPDASVAAPRYMLPMLANRMSLYQTHRLLDYHDPEPEYIIMDRDWNRIDAAQKWKSEYETLAVELKSDRNYTAIYHSSNYIVYRSVGSIRNLLQGEGTP